MGAERVRKWASERVIGLRLEGCQEVVALGESLFTREEDGAEIQ